MPPGPHASASIRQHDLDSAGRTDDDAAALAEASAAIAVSTSAMLLRGVELAKAGQLDFAAETLAKCILQDPTSADAHEALSTVLLALGNVHYASKAKAKAVSLGYNSPSDWEILGDMFTVMGQPDDAARAFQTASLLDPGSAELQDKARLSATAAQMASQPVARATAGVANLADLGMANLDMAALDVAPAPAAPIPDIWRRVNLVTIEPDGYPHAAAFHDLADSFEQGLRSLGIQAARRRNSIGLEGINLLFGAHLIESQELADKIPSNTVIVNLEQLQGFNVAAKPVYVSLLRRLAVWDYSIRNVAGLQAMTMSPYVRRVGIGYTPAMTRWIHPEGECADVLFYGSLNERRNDILIALRAAGLNVRHLFGIYGHERDAAIANAKVVLNLHFYEDSIHEIVRTSYLLANSKAVVAECGPKTEIDDDMREAMVAVPYEGIADACIALVRDDARRMAVERRAFEIFSRRDQATMLSDAIAVTVLPGIG